MSQSTSALTSGLTPSPIGAAFEILSVISQGAVKRARQASASKMHPDETGTIDTSPKFRQCQRPYEILAASDFPTTSSEASYHLPLEAGLESLSKVTVFPTDTDTDSDVEEDTDFGKQEAEMRAERARQARKAACRQTERYEQAVENRRPVATRFVFIPFCLVGIVGIPALACIDYHTGTSLSLLVARAMPDTAILLLVVVIASEAVVWKPPSARVSSAMAVGLHLRRSTSTPALV